MNKAYSRIVWENYPSVQTPLNEQNLNKMDSAVNEIDDRVINMETTKANQSELLGALSNVTYNDQTGVFVFTWKNGNTLTVDLAVEKIPTSFSMSTDGVITMTNADGTTYTADISSLIKTYTFNNANGITWNVTTDASGNKIVKAAINDGSITEAKLEVNFLANCRAAQSGAEAAKATSQAEALVSEGYARGTQNGVDVPSSSPYYHNNAKYYSDKAGGSSLSGLSDTDIQNPENGNVITYDSSNGKWVNDGSLPEKVKTSELAYLGYTVPYEMPIQNYIDSNRVFHQRVGRVDLSTLTYVAQTSTQGRYDSSSLANVKAFGFSNLYCSKYKTLSDGSVVDKSIRGASVNGNIVIIDTSMATNTQLKESLKGVYLYYELATEITFNADGNEKIPSLEKHFEVNEYTIPHESLNLIPYPYADGMSKTHNGITYTVNADDGSIVANGTATGTYSAFKVAQLNVGSGVYFLNGCVNGGSTGTYRLQIYDGTNKIGYNDFGNGVVANLISGNDNAMYIRIENGVTVNNLVFRPTLVKGTEIPNCLGWLNSSALVGKALGKNLLNPILDSTTVNGVTCESLGNGTYRLNGTSTADAYFSKTDKDDYINRLDVDKNYYLLGNPNTYRNEWGMCVFLRITVKKTDGTSKDYYVFNFKPQPTKFRLKDIIANGEEILRIWLYIRVAFSQGATTVNNVVVKPMIVDADLYPNVTYDDFEPYITLTAENAADYPKYARINSDKYGYDFVAQYVDVLPVSGAFYTDTEADTREMLNPNVIFDPEGVLVFASDTATADIKFRIGGVV